ncbi:head-tail connector protein [Pseudochrobactrum sp. MP213Fo]|uniref:head-tail connector protein n=1 Tax=Pseudochrobactrum sp. MP213Fo TaxID=3022250 RepID=UPI003BA0D810
MNIITLSEFKDHARILYDDEDSEIQVKVDATNEYLSGFIELADGAEIPADLKQAGLMIAAHWFENRETALPDSLHDIPVNASEILLNYRGWAF